MGTLRRTPIAALCCALVQGCSNTPSPAPPAAPMEAAPSPYVLENTEVRHLESSSLKRDYPVFVSLPSSYGEKATHRFPVMFVTDATYAFPLIRSIARRVGDHGAGLEEFILIGLSYAKGETPEYSRRRDYTPTINSDKGAVSDMPGRVPVYGEAEANVEADGPVSERHAQTYGSFCVFDAFRMDVQDGADYPFEVECAIPNRSGRDGVRS